jgi:hypothetical protein
MPPTLNAIFHALLVLAWWAAGYAALSLAMHPCAEHGVIAAMMVANAGALLWLVFSRRVVRRG